MQLWTISVVSLATWPALQRHCQVVKGLLTQRRKYRMPGGALQVQVFNTSTFHGQQFPTSGGPKDFGCEIIKYIDDTLLYAPEEALADC